MRLYHVEEEAGTPGAATLVHCLGSDGTTGDGRGRAIPRHLLGEPVLPDGGCYFLKWLECFPRPDGARYGAFRELHSRGPPRTIPGAMDSLNEVSRSLKAAC